MIDKEECRNQINSLTASEIWMHGTLEIYHGGIFPNEKTYCGLCWQKIKNNNPGERLFDWKYMLEELEELFEAMDHYKTDKNHPDYKFLASKFTLAKIHNRVTLKENMDYTDLEIICLGMEVNGNRLEIPQDIFIDNYKEVKQVMSKFGGVYSKNGFKFKYDAKNVIERIMNKETMDLKKEYQFFETPSSLCDELCDMTFDSNLNYIPIILEPQAGQGAIMTAMKKWWLTYGNTINNPCLMGIELMKENFQILKDKFPNYTLLNQDFLEYNKEVDFFDYVIGNPPFSKGQDIQHFYKMYEVCKPGGTVTCIMSTSWLFNSNKKFQDFRKWLGINENELMQKEAGKGNADYLGVRSSENGNDESVLVKTYEAGTFKESGTNVITCVVQIKKNDTSIKIQKNNTLILF